MLTAMQAVVVHEPGSTEVLRLEEVPLPEVGRADVLLHVHAAGVNPIDHELRQSGGGELVDPPFIPGMDVSGTVEAIGEDVQGFAIGDAVHGFASVSDGYGAYARYTAVAADRVVHKPSSLDHVHAAAVPMAGLTAWQALHEHAAVRPDERVLIHGGAGGVGHLAVQLARHHGAYVIATGSTKESHELLHELGADVVVDYEDVDVVTEVGDVDVVVDTVGGVFTDRALEMLGPQGRLVSLIDDPDEKRARDRGVTAVRMSVRWDAEQLRQIDQLLDRGEIRVVVDQTFPLVEVAHAHRRSEEGHVHGKLVLDIVG